MGQTTVQIGSGTSLSDEPPFGMDIPYERSAAVYTHSELGFSNGLIIQLGWSVVTSDPNSCPAKIYLKLTSSSTLNAVTWSSMISGATLVYNGPVSFTTTGWHTIDIADFVYSSASSHLLVLCETDFGVNVAFSSPKFQYTTTSQNQHEFWSGVSPPTGNGSPNKNRPNIQITYTALSAVVPPSGFMAVADSSSRVNLNWIKNTANDNVMLAFNTTNTFGTPSGTYVPGNAITGGGTVIYNNSGTSFSQVTGLSPNTIYYYRAWSVHPSVPTYSSGTSSTATTFCTITGMYPDITDFETITFPPPCWSSASVPWISGNPASAFGSGTGSAKADFFDIYPGNFDLISPELDLSSMPFPVIKFDYAYACDTTTHFNQVDRLELWYSKNNGVSDTLLNTWLGGLNGPLNTGGTMTIPFVPGNTQWKTKRCALPSGTNKIMFRGVSYLGNNLYIDNITFYDTACATLSLPYNEGFDHYTIPTTGCIKVTDDNLDTYKWGTSGSYPCSVPNSIYINHNPSAQMNDWFFTPALSLTSGKTYAVDFYYRSGGSPSVEKLELKFGTSQNSGGMGGGQIWNNTNIQTTTYQEGYATFTPSSTTSYYVGWHGYSAANMSWLCVDDIHIDLASVSWNGINSDDWSDPLNWTPNIVPNGYQNVTLQSGGPHDPTIYNNGLACRLLTIKNGVTLTLNSGSGITVKSNLTIENGATLVNNGVITLKGNLINLN